jgi:TolB-like protein/DNA-binding winged helix-turn-helix (wHTH) protein/Flp pilus assembly protein TadD
VLEPVPTSQVMRFGNYEVDLCLGELRKNGKRVKLTGQPFQILVVLLEHPGDLVTREQLQGRLWPADTFVDFDRGLNAAINRMREALGDSAENPRFVETLPRRGYRFIAPIVDPRTSRTARSQPTSPSAAILGRLGTEEKRRSPKRLTLLVTTFVALALIAVALVVDRISGTGVKQPGTIRSLAVLPLQNISGDPGQQYLADGMTEELIGRLAAIRNLRVISRTSVMRFKNTNLSAPEIAKTVGADAIVEGSVMREGSRIRVHAQLIRAATEEHFWSEAYDREVRDVLDLESDVAQSIANKVEVSLTGEERHRLASVRAVDPEVYENYLKGRFALAKGNNRADVEESIRYFNVAISKDPRHALSYLGLAEAYGWLGTVFIGGVAQEYRPKRALAARKALELDPTLVEAHLLLAYTAQEEWRWAEAQAEYQKAVALRPNDASAHSGLGFWLTCQGRAEEALAETRHGRELDPLAVSGDELGSTLFLARRYGEAEHEVRSELAIRPDNARALVGLAFVLVSNHNAREAVDVLERAASISGRAPAIVGLLIYAYAQSGDRAHALRLLQELKRRKQRGYVPAAAFMLGFLGLGDYDQAFFWIEEAYKEQSNILQFLKVNPIFDPVRSDPRFFDLLRRVGLDQLS